MKTLKKILLTIAITISLTTFIQAKAENYQNLETRINQNIKMQTNTNDASYQAAERYTEKSLKDLKELNYIILTNNQQTKLKEFTNNIIFENQNYTRNEKIAKIYDFITKNFYYYDTPEKIIYFNYSNKEHNNPYSLITKEYEKYGKTRANNEGITLTLIALLRLENIPARMVEGYYDKNLPENTNPLNLTKSNINHKWVEVYLNGNWISLDPTLDINKKYNDQTNEYIENSSTTNYYNPSINFLSKTHIILNYQKGKQNKEYITNQTELNQIKYFLGQNQNGKKINKSYTKNNSKTWFSTNSTNDGYGNTEKLYWTPNKNLTGTLSLKNFQKLKILSVPKNKITNITITNCPSLEQVYVYRNNLNKLTITGSPLKVLSARYNPATYIKYNFGKTKKTAVLKATTGGVISVYYKQTSTSYKHTLRAVPKKGYKFIGWYKQNKKISSKKDVSIYNKSSFTYTAKFKKINKTYILISIKKQKLYYYKNGKIKLTSKVVTGTKNKYDTPKGTFKIEGKAKNVYLIGKDYKNFVNYWMLINRKTQIGLHDAPWRSTFGGNIYKYNGSHGCINLPYNVAKTIYKTAAKGTTVIIK